MKIGVGLRVYYEIEKVLQIEYMWEHSKFFWSWSTVKSGKKLYKGWRMNTQVHPYETQQKSCRDDTCIVRRPEKYVIIYF